MLTVRATPGLQVVFDSQNPYRRKSSLVTTETGNPRFRKPVDKGQCLVHQFLESQRRVHNGRHGHGSHDAQVIDGDGVDTALEHSLRRRVEPKGSGPQDKCAVLDSAASESEGQVDERNWRHGVVRATSELDVGAVEGDAMHSRLLTKKQLSEMAWGVRELSRRLGSMRLKFRVKSILLLTKIYDEDLIPKTRELTRWLLDKDREVRYTVYLERNLKDNKILGAAALLDEVRADYIAAGEADEEASRGISKRLRWWTEEMCRTRPHTFDFVITLGGDGTVLYASWLFQRIVPPVLSFSLGSLGFLTKFDFNEYQSTLTTAFNAGVTVSLRLRFEGTIMRSQKKHIVDVANIADEDRARLQKARDLVEELIGEEKDDEHTHRPDGTFEILNEIVVDRGPNPSKKQSKPSP